MESRSSVDFSPGLRVRPRAPTTWTGSLSDSDAIIPASGVIKSDASRIDSDKRSEQYNLRSLGLHNPIVSFGFYRLRPPSDGFLSDLARLSCRDSLSGRVITRYNRTGGITQ